MPHIAFSTPSRTLFAIPYWIAEQQGYFAEEGLSVSLDIVGDTAVLKERLRKRQNHISIDSPDTVILDAMSGGPLRMIAGNACRPPLFIIARPHIAQLRQLRGATFGVLSLKEGSSKFIPRIAEAAGLSTSDVTVIEVGGAPARKQLLLDGVIDAGLQPMPLSFEAEAAGLNNLGWTGQFEPYWQFTTINTNIQWARANPEVVTGALRALARAMASMRTDLESASLIAARELQSAPHFAERAILETLELGILDPHLECSEQGLSRIIDNLKADGLLHGDDSAVLAGSAEFSFLRGLDIRGQ